HGPTGYDCCSGNSAASRPPGPAQGAADARRRLGRYGRHPRVAAFAEAMFCEPTEVCRLSPKPRSLHLRLGRRDQPTDAFFSVGATTAGQAVSRAFDRNLRQLLESAVSGFTALTVSGLEHVVDIPANVIAALRDLVAQGHEEGYVVSAFLIAQLGAWF